MIIPPLRYDPCMTGWLYLDDVCWVALGEKDRALQFNHPETFQITCFCTHMESTPSSWASWEKFCQKRHLEGNPGQIDTSRKVQFGNC